LTDVDPAVDRVIRRCLDREPSKRPASALAVAAALPGGDPLAAALAAGETPAPALVAAAGGEGALRPAVAVALLSAVVLLLPLCAALKPRAAPYALLPADPPDAMAGRARDLLRRVTSADPAMTRAGMRLVRLDARGQLLELTVVPPQVESETADASDPAPDWAPLFAAAGLDPSKFDPAPPRWLPAFVFDRRASWSGPAPERGDVTLRVEAASYRGRPVWFGVFGPWSQPARQVGFTARPGERAGNILGAAIFLLLLAVCVALARRNLRLSRGDRQGARRLATYFFALSLLGWMLGATHVPAYDELYLFWSNVGWSLFMAALVWATYLALEPIVRRRWPHVIIGWSRVLSAKISDALVGSDVLVGLAVGLLIQTSQYLVALWFPPSLPKQLDLISLSGLESLRKAMAILAGVQVPTIYVSLAVCLVYVASYTVLRRHWLTGAAVVGVFVVLDLLFFGSLPAVVLGVLVNTVLVLVLTRFGLLAVMAGAYTINVFTNFPMTTDLTQWYASTGLIGIGALLALAVWAFRTSLGGQPVLKEA
jgi:serine/threonine-protein kinase